MRREHIERLLPVTFQRSVTGHGVLDALLAVMETLHEPSEAVLSQVDDLVSAYRTPDVLVPFLVSWVAFDHLDLASVDVTTPAGYRSDGCASWSATRPRWPPPAVPPRGCAGCWPR